MFDIDFLVVDSLRWRFRGIFFDIGFRQGFQPILSSLGFWIIIRKASLAAFHVNGHLLLNGNCSTSGVNQSSKCLNTKSCRNKNLILSAKPILQKSWHFDQEKSYNIIICLLVFIHKHFFIWGLLLILAFFLDFVDQLLYLL